MRASRGPRRALLSLALLAAGGLAACGGSVPPTSQRSPAVPGASVEPADPSTVEDPGEIDDPGDTGASLDPGEQASGDLGPGTDAESTPGPTSAAGVAGPGGWTRLPDAPELTDFEMRDAVAGGPGLVMVGYDGAHDEASVRTSADGVHWDRAGSVSDAGGAAMSGVTVGGPGFLAVGSAGGSASGSVTSRSAVWTSPDGVDWTRVPDDPVFADSSMAKVARRSGRMVAVGSTSVAPPEDPAVPFDESGHAVVWLSDDGRTWRRSDDDPSFARSAMTWLAAGPLGFVAASGQSDTQLDATMWSSPDGEHWETATTPEVFRDATVYSVTAAGPGWVAVGAAAQAPAAWTSADGLAWTRSPSIDAAGDANPVDLAGSGDRIVAVGTNSEGAVVWTSLDGMTWTRLPRDPAFFGGFMVRVIRGPAGMVAFGLPLDDTSGNDNATWTAPFP